MRRPSCSVLRERKECAGTERLGLGNLFGESSRLITIRLGIRLTLFMRLMGRRVADTGPCSRDSVAHFRVSKEVTPRIVPTHRPTCRIPARRDEPLVPRDRMACRAGRALHLERGPDA